MGYDVELTTQKKKVSELVWNKEYTNAYDENGNLKSTNVNAYPEVINGEVEVPAIKTITPNASFGGNINNISSSAPSTVKNPSNTGGKSPSGGGGDNKGPTKPKKV
jgi:hypothetical protein